jgi:hypothetical protein
VHTKPYFYDKHHPTRYTFISKGKNGAITKVVEFNATAVKNIVNLGFGDLRADGTIDDLANSNNSDITKVLATIIAIVEEFTGEYPNTTIVFTGSTTSRTRLYQRILKTYYQAFRRNFIITALYDNGNQNYMEVPFDPATDNKYVAFFIKRK